MRLPSNGDLPFLHHLKQSALNLGGCAVNFIGQQKVGKHRAQDGAEFAGLLIEDAGAHKVGRQQVGRELDATETAIQCFGQGDWVGVAINGVFAVLNYKLNG